MKDSARGDFQGFSSMKGVRVLLMEDNAVNVLVASQFLKSWEVIVDVVDNGISGLELLAQQQYDLVLMDLQMPRMDGYQTAEKIRQGGNETNRKVPIIAITASNSPEAWNKAIDKGMDDFISKPFNANELHRVLERYVLKGSTDKVT